METWYSTTIEVCDEHGWRPLHAPFVEATDAEAGEFIGYQVMAYDLDGEPRPWRVRVYAGYNRYDELVTERVGGRQG